MDVRDLVASFPMDHQLRRLIEFCTDDLGLSTNTAALILERAATIARAADLMNHAIRTGEHAPPGVGIGSDFPNYPL